ncbi:MAG TPA: immunoglobulin domain-containing protein [Lacunisphaera sp.]|nr:immunoglobulin domain-containing protein [Lacunisphaera sp.]
MFCFFRRGTIFRAALLALAFGFPFRTCAAADFVVMPFAGAASTGSADGRGADARFNSPQGVMVDALGQIWVADTGNRTIRRISSSGQVTTIAGVVGQSEMVNGPASTAKFNRPTGVAQDGAGNLYVADQLMVRKITPDGIVSTLAGWPFIPHVNPPPLFTGTSGLTLDALGNVYIAAYIGTSGNGLARIAPDGTVSVLLQQVNEWPGGVALDATGKIYYTFFGNGFHEGISILAPGGVRTPFVGGGGGGAADGVGSAATFNIPVGLKFGPDGKLQVADSANNLIRTVTTAGQVTTLAGLPPPPGPNPGWSEGILADGTGNAARFWNPTDVAPDAAGNIYVADTGNNAIRRITPAGETTTVAGLYPASRGRLDGLGAAARFAGPWGIAVGPLGELYVADSGNHLIRRIDPTGAVTTFATLTATGTPNWVAADAAGNVYVSDSDGLVQKISREGAITRLGSFVSAGGLAVDAAGNVFVADPVAGVVRRIPAGGGNATTLPLPAAGSSPRSVALDRAGNLYVLSMGFPQSNTQTGSTAYVCKITPAGVTSIIVGSPGGVPTGSKELFMLDPRALAVDASGNAYVTGGLLVGQSEQRIYQITPAGELSVLNLTAASGSPDVLFSNLVGVACDALGALYVTDSAFTYNRISKVLPAGGRPEITTQPQSQTVAAGASVRLAVTATGTPAPTYQWYFNQAAINGATESSLSLAGVQAADAGEYSVVVRNAWGEVTSAKATLALVTPNPPSAPGGGQAGGGGGGAPSAWFVLSLLGLGAIRARLWRLG